MSRAPRAAIGFALVLVAVTITVVPGGAHKPITSPFTYNDDVFPILRDRCGRCHVRDGVAPMSLMTYEDTVPWGESIRVELLAGHMPPWSVDGASWEASKHPRVQFLRSAYLYKLYLIRPDVWNLR